MDFITQHVTLEPYCVNRDQRRTQSHEVELDPIGAEYAASDSTSFQRNPLFKQPFELLED